MIRRSVHEWEHLSYGEGEDQIPEGVAGRLVAAAKSSSIGGKDGNRILEHGRKSLRARQVVGVVAAEGCCLEILPKIYGLNDDDVRHKLVHMLAIALDLDVSSGAMTALGWQRDNLLEILIGLFSKKLLDALRKGMPRQYISSEEDLPTLRGRLHVFRQFSSLAASPQKLACRYDELSPDIALNQIMKAAITRLLQIASTTANLRRLRELGFAYCDITAVPVGALRWDLVVLDRTNARWAELLNLAQLLLGEKFQTTTSGPSQGFSLLFEMNVLFEQYLGKMLKRALRGTDLRVVTQGGGAHCLTELDGAQKRRFHTRPDIRITKGGKTVLIIDTKWKRLSRRIDDPKQGISQADVYQMMAYGELYQCHNLMLLYPHHSELGTTEGKTGRHLITGVGRVLTTATFDVAKQDDEIKRLTGLVDAELSYLLLEHVS